MAVDFKSHVLLRDEKGLFGIPFKRWLGAGVGGGAIVVGEAFARAGPIANQGSGVELDDRGITFITLRMRSTSSGKTLLSRNRSRAML